MTAKVMSNQEITSVLFITKSTIKFHVSLHPGQAELRWLDAGGDHYSHARHCKPALSLENLLTTKATEHSAT